MVLVPKVKKKSDQLTNKRDEGLLWKASENTREMDPRMDGFYVGDVTSVIYVGEREVGSRCVRLVRSNGSWYSFHVMDSIS